MTDPARPDASRGPRDTGPGRPGKRRKPRRSAAYPIVVVTSRQGVGIVTMCNCWEQLGCPEHGRSGSGAGGTNGAGDGNSAGATNRAEDAAP